METMFSLTIIITKSSKLLYMEKDFEDNILTHYNYASCICNNFLIWSNVWGLLFHWKFQWHIVNWNLDVVLCSITIRWSLVFPNCLSPNPLSWSAKSTTNQIHRALPCLSLPPGFKWGWQFWNLRVPDLSADCERSRKGLQFKRGTWWGHRPQCWKHFKHSVQAFREKFQFWPIISKHKTAQLLSFSNPTWTLYYSRPIIIIIRCVEWCYNCLLTNYHLRVGIACLTYYLRVCTYTECILLGLLLQIIVM